MSSIVVQNGQDIFDVSLTAYGDASLAYNLIAENPGIDSILSDLTGMTLNYTSAYYPQKEAVKKVVLSKKVVTIQSTQTLFDIALQYYGSVENVYQLISENPLIESVLDTNYAGRTLNYTENKTMIPNYFLTNKIDFSTRFPESGIVYGVNFLLQDDGFYLLQDDGFKILI